MLGSGREVSTKWRGCERVRRRAGRRASRARRRAAGAKRTKPPISRKRRVAWPRGPGSVPCIDPLLVLRREVPGVGQGEHQEVALDLAVAPLEEDRLALAAQRELRAGKRGGDEPLQRAGEGLAQGDGRAARQDGGGRHPQLHGQLLRVEGLLRAAQHVLQQVVQAAVGGRRGRCGRRRRRRARARRRRGRAPAGSDRPRGGTVGAEPSGRVDPADPRPGRGRASGRRARPPPCWRRAASCWMRPARPAACRARPRGRPSAARRGTGSRPGPGSSRARARPGPPPARRWSAASGGAAPRRRGRSRRRVCGGRGVQRIGLLRDHDLGRARRRPAAAARGRTAAAPLHDLREGLLDDRGHAGGIEALLLEVVLDARWRPACPAPPPRRTR